MCCSADGADEVRLTSRLCRSTTEEAAEPPCGGRSIRSIAKILLLDGNSMAYRAFFALPTDLATASGQVTNAVYGFTSMLINLFKDHHPDAIAVAFDRPERTFRHDLVDDYKAGRAAAPDILRQQMGLVRQVVETLKIPIVEIAGFEADDVIATLATQARDRGDDVIVVTGDRDAYQLVEDPHVKVLYNRRGVSDYVLYDEAGILERTGVTPAAVPAVRGPAGRPVRQPARRARGRGEDGGQAAQHLRRPRRGVRQRRQVHAQAAGEPDRPRAGGAPQRHRHAARPRRRPRASTSATCAWASSTPPRCGTCSTSSSSTPSTPG